MERDQWKSRTGGRKQRMERKRRLAGKRAARKRVILLAAVFAAVLLAVMTAEYFVIDALQPDAEQIAAEKLHEAMQSQTPEPIATAAPTPSPAAVPDEASAAEVSSGKRYTEADSGEEVAFIQQMLIDLGFDPGNADGVFGDMLSRAILEFQMYCGVEADGTAGPDTIALLVEKWQQSRETKAAANQPLAGIRIGIDAGHQRVGNTDPELVSPNGTDIKNKVTNGTYGRFTGVREAVINLEVALRLKRELEALGAQVVMTRTTHDVDISNSQRAIMMNNAEVDCWLRIHANYDPDPAVSGMFILVSAPGTMNTDDESVAQTSRALAAALIEAAAEATGAQLARTGGIVERSDQTGFCWSSVPVCNIEMGHMTNEQDDLLLVTEAYQIRIVQGLANGFAAFFSGGQ